MLPGTWEVQQTQANDYEHCFLLFFGGGCHFSPTTLLIKGLFKNNPFVKIQSLGDLLEMWPSESWIAYFLVRWVICSLGPCLCIWVRDVSNLPWYLFGDCLLYSERRVLCRSGVASFEGVLRMMSPLGQLPVVWLGSLLIGIRLLLLSVDPPPIVSVSSPVKSG